MQAAKINREKVDFIHQDFDNLVRDKGNILLWERAIFCPCRKDITTQAKSNCINCEGLGWFYELKETIDGFIQSITSKSVTRMQWSDILEGTALLTVKSLSKIGWMDRITVSSAETIFTEQKVAIAGSPDETVTLEYVPVKIVKAFKFINEETPLQKLDVDKLLISENSKVVTIQDTNVSAGDNISFLYEYNPVYLIIDVLNDFRNLYDGQQAEKTDQTLNKYPLRCMIKKAHLFSEGN